MQVLTLLEQMGLKKLQDNFMAERVTGEILLECDEEVLYQELKVAFYSMRIHIVPQYSSVGLLSKSRLHGSHLPPL